MQHVWRTIRVFISSTLYDMLTKLNRLVDVNLHLGTLRLRNCDCGVRNLAMQAERSRRRIFKLRDEAIRRDINSICRHPKMLFEDVRDVARLLPGEEMPSQEQVDWEVVRHHPGNFHVISRHSYEIRKAQAYLRKLGPKGKTMASHLVCMARKGLVRAGPLEGFLACPFIDKDGHFGERDLEYLLISTSYPFFDNPFQRSISCVHDIGAVQKFNLPHEINQARGAAFRVWNPSMIDFLKKLFFRSPL